MGTWWGRGSKAMKRSAEVQVSHQCMYGRIWENSEVRVKLILTRCLHSRYFISLVSLISLNTLGVVIFQMGKLRFQPC